MDFIREPLLVVCMIIVVGGMLTMASLIITLVIKGALKPHSSEKPTNPPQSPPVTSGAPAPAPRPRPMAQTASS